MHHTAESYTSIMSSTRSTLLLADDDPTIADSLAPFLERAGFHVLVVSDGMSALEKAQAHHPELIILDVLMPRMDGRETLRHLRKAKIWTPTILLTQVGEASERVVQRRWMFHALTYDPLPTATSFAHHICAES